jgi:hypothetical protein
MAGLLQFDARKIRYSSEMIKLIGLSRARPSFVVHLMTPLVDNLVQWRRYTTKILIENDFQNHRAPGTVELSFYWGLLGFEACSSSGILKNTSRKLDLFPSSGKGVGDVGDTYPVESLRKSQLQSLPHLKTETDPVYETCSLLFFRIPDDAKKNGNPECHTPSSEPFKINPHLIFLDLSFSPN